MTARNRLIRAGRRARHRWDDPRSDAGQTTAEYGLVILAAGTLALVAILWARDSGSITSLFEDVIEHLTDGID
ncbi:MAG: DUF4244 domain-containing protein [Acidimicrobiales bacterium]